MDIIIIREYSPVFFFESRIRRKSTKIGQRVYFRNAKFKKKILDTKVDNKISSNT